MKLLTKEEYNNLSQKEMKDQEQLVAKCFGLEFKEKEMYNSDTLSDLYKNGRSPEFKKGIELLIKCIEGNI